MSRFFDGGSDFLLVDSVPTTGEYPITMACWFKADDITKANRLVFIGDKDNTTFWVGLQARGDRTGTPIMAFNHQHDGAGSGFAESAAAYTANVWHHAGAVFVSTSDRTAYLNGVGTQDTASGPNAPSGWDRMSVGFLGDSTPDYSRGVDIADVGIWLAELTANEMMALARGARPNQIRQESLVFYSPITGASPEPDWSGSKRNLTVTGATITNPPPVIPHSARYWGHGPLVEAAPTGGFFARRYYDEFLAGAA